MSELWFEASDDHDAISRQAALAQAEGHMAPLWGFFFQASSANELDHRLAVGETRLFHVARQCGLEVTDLEELVRRRYALLVEALAEGQDPVAEVVNATHFNGSGPEYPYEHDEAVDYSHGYSEVPQGAPGGPVPNVVQPDFEKPQQVSMATAASRCSCGRKMKNGKCKGCKSPSADCDCAPVSARNSGPDSKLMPAKARRYANGQASGDYVEQTPPDTGTGRGSVDLDVTPGSPSLREGSRRTAATTSGSPASGPPAANLPAGMSQQRTSPDGVSPGSMASSTAQAPLAAPSTGVQSSSTQYDLTPAQDVVTAVRRDPVAAQIRAIASSIQSSNPGLPDTECRRIARRVVGSYLRQGDLSSSVTSDQPWQDAPGGGGNSGGGGLSGLEEYGLGKGLISKLPGGGGSGAAAGLADAAELAAV